MLLSVLDRIMIESLLPETGTILTAKPIAELRKELNFSSDEIKEWSIARDGNTTTWNIKKAKDIEVKFNNTAFDVISNKLKDMSEAEEINTHEEVGHISLYDRFVKEL